MSSNREKKWIVRKWSSKFRPIKIETLESSHKHQVVCRLKVQLFSWFLNFNYGLQKYFSSPSHWSDRHRVLPASGFPFIAGLKLKLKVFCCCCSCCPPSDFFLNSVKYVRNLLKMIIGRDFVRCKRAYVWRLHKRAKHVFITCRTHWWNFLFMVNYVVQWLTNLAVSHDHNNLARELIQPVTLLYSPTNAAPKFL